jgi:hypothetical protein
MVCNSAEPMSAQRTHRQKADGYHVNAKDLGPWMYIHRWTMARPLWEAKNALEFGRRWKTSSQFVVANHALDGFVHHGRAEDVDEFCKIMLSM